MLGVAVVEPSDLVDDVLQRGTQVVDDLASKDVPVSREDTPEGGETVADGPANGIASLIALGNDWLPVVRIGREGIAVRPAEVSDLSFQLIEVFLCPLYPEFREGEGGPLPHLLPLEGDADSAERGTNADDPGGGRA